MTKIRLFASLLAVCIIQMCMAGRIQREAVSTSSNSEESNESSEESSAIKWTAAENEQYNAINNTLPALKERIREGVSFELFIALLGAVKASRNLPVIQRYVTYCDVLDPDSSANKLPPPVDGDEYFEKLNHASDFLPAIEINPFVKNNICPYIRNPEYSEDYAKSLEFSRRQYHQMQDIRRRNSDQSLVGRAAVGRKICKVAQESKIIADITKSPKQLSEQELTAFDELLTLAKNANDSSRAEKFRNVCSSLDVTISPAEQAEALKIPVDLYNKIVVIRKEIADDFEIGNQIKAWTKICNAINENDNISNKTYAEGVIVPLPVEKKFLTLIRKAESVKNSKKIGKWRKACELLPAKEETTSN